MEYRAKARIIAFVDLVFAIMWLLLTLIYFLVAVGLTMIRNEPQDKLKNAIITLLRSYEYNSADYAFFNDGKELMDLAIHFYVFSVFLTIIGLLQLVAVIKLWSATEIGMDSVGAVELARLWYAGTLTSLMSGGLVPVLIAHPIGSAILLMFLICGNLIFNGIGIYIVHNFVLELRGTVSKPEVTMSMMTGLGYSQLTPQPEPDQGEVVDEKI